MHEELPNRDEIWDSIAAEDGVLRLTEAEKQEIDRRLAALDADPSSAIPWEEVKQEALARSQRLRNKG